MTKLRLIGDVHGNHNVIIDALQTCHQFDLTIQLGDFGAGFGAEAYLPLVSGDKFKVLHGNHDNYDKLISHPHNLGRFGVFDFAGKKIFFVAGAWSIDQQFRKEGVSWWQNEELSTKEAIECLDLWDAECKNIDILLSHDGPSICTQHILKAWPTSTHTGKLLDEIFKIHAPPVWRFGHWHKCFSIKIDNTDFKCLNINEAEVIEW